MKNHRTLVTPPAPGRRLRCTVPLLRARRRLAAALKASAPAPARSHLTTGRGRHSPAARAWARSGPGHHAAVGRPIGECLAIDVADRTAGATTIVCLLITIQRVR
jgi:hypothetical protein